MTTTTGPHRRQATQNGMTNCSGRVTVPGASGFKSWPSGRVIEACTSLHPLFETAICPCHCLLRIENPIAKLTLPIDRWIPMCLHPLSASWASPSREHPSAPSAVRHSNHNADQNRKGEGEQCGAKHHNGGRGKQKNSRQSNQKGDGVEPEARRSPPQSSKNAINGHKGPILGLAAGRRRLPEPVSAVV